MRTLRRNVSASSGSAPPAVEQAARDFRFDARIKIKRVFVGAKCRTVEPSSRCEGRKLAGGVSAVREACRLRRFAWGRPGTKGRVSERVCHTTFVTVPPR